MPNGKEKRKRSKDKAVVQDWLLEQRKAISDNRVLADDKITFNEFADRFLEDVAQHSMKERTLDSYESYLRIHIRPELGNIKLAAIQPQNIQRLYTKKLNAGLSNKTVHHIHTYLRRVLNEAVKWELIYRNPCSAVTPPRVEKSTPKVWTVEQAQTFLKAVKGHRWEGVYLIALCLGARRGEILGMEWENVNWQRGTITIEKTIVELRGKAVVTPPKTHKSRRTLTLPDVVLNLLKQNPQNTGFIFISSTGTPIHPRNWLDTSTASWIG